MSGAPPPHPHPVTSLREEVICTTCLSLPRVAMYQCENGHLICKDCMAKCVSNICPTCKKPLGKIRSIIADKIISLLPLPCRHSDHGCPEELYLERLDVHELSCQFRPICCVDIACSAKVSFCKMLDHMAKDHEAGDFVHANGREYKSYFIVNEDDFVREIMWISDHLTLDGRHFFRECCRSPDGNWHVWIYLLGSPAEAASYRTTVKIVLPTSGEELIYKGRVNALNSPTRQLPKDLAALTFPDCVARKFWHSKKIHYEVEIDKNPPKKIVKPVNPDVSDLSSTSGEVSENKEVEASSVPEQKVAAEPEPESVGVSEVDEQSQRKGERKKKSSKKSKGQSSDDVKETSC